jgi:hypothetical protein
MVMDKTRMASIAMMVSVVILMCSTRSVITGMAQTQQNFTLGVIVAYQAGQQTDYLNARYWTLVQQALLDIKSGYRTITPPMPAGRCSIWAHSRNADPPCRIHSMSTWTFVICMDSGMGMGMVWMD